MVNVSVVLYQTPTCEVMKLIRTLRASDVIQHIYLIDNSKIPTLDFNNEQVEYLFNSKNLGYGRAHNLAIRKSIEQATEYHLVMNSDLEFEPEILSLIEKYMNQNNEIGLLMPKIVDPSGQIQYLCKLLPTPIDLLLRRFLPDKWTSKQRSAFELHDTGYNHTMDVPYLSGCFMFLRVSALKQIGLFDERFFLYPEDIDLSRRMHQKHRTVFFPSVTVIHHHAQSSYKNLKMLWIHTINLFKYFNKWGWILDKERKTINKKIKNQLINT